MASPKFVVARQCLDASTIDRIYAEIAEEVLARATIGGGKLDDRRVARVLWLRRPEWDWLFELLWGAADWVNRSNWDYALGRNATTSVQFSRYDAGGKYLWHKDRYPRKARNSARRLSVAVTLRNAERGGGFGIRGVGLIPMNPGDAAIFPSYVEHCAFEVVEGYRDSLTLWLER